MAESTSDLAAYVQAILKDKVDTTSVTGEEEAVAFVVSKADALVAVEGRATDVEGLFKLFVKSTGITHVNALVEKLTADSNNTTLKLRILANVFNSTPVANAPLRFHTLLSIIKYAGSTDNLALVQSYFKDIYALATGFSTDNLKALYLTIADLLEKAHDEHAALLFLEKYLAIVPAADAASAKDVAVRAAVLVVKSPIQSFVANVDLIHLPAVKALEGSNKIYDLLDIFSSKTLADYLKFEASSGAILKEHGIDAAAAAANIRLLTLCSYPTGHDEIPFDDIVAKLQVAEADIETWVVRAITANLIEAKINQLDRSVVISRSLQRGVGLDNWKELHATLLRYKTNVGSLLDTIRRAQVSATK
ncbi:hypothetical protein LEN26_017297 [Aphanomyces euteiches]|nr:hypothetical protein LEN26_017297 [Aphanomyces euteiches]KAH9128093.1 hypothetical protein AeMF1_001708 [Aphanomyces euteiches]KAH9192471.1 hypothetical protein AeNC1_005562 [Aphanomyces euteiches]